jgi:hypothetical protein
MALGVLLAMGLLLLLGGAVGAALTWVIKRVFKLKTMPAVALGVVLSLLGGVGLFAFIFPDTLRAYWDQRDPPTLRFTLPDDTKGYRIVVVMEDSGPALVEHDSVVEIPVPASHVVHAKKSGRLENDYATYAGVRPDGASTPVVGDAVGFTPEGTPYRVFFVGTDDERMANFNEELPKF